MSSWQQGNQGSSNWSAQSWSGGGSGGQQAWNQGGAGQGGGAASWQQPAAQAPAANNWSQPQAQGQTQISVQGCQHQTIGSIVRGDFTVHSENHAKPVYKKTSQVSGLDVMIYFWDERDGASQAGWWFGPKVGGEQVWAYNPDLTTNGPPKSGWQVPYGGPIDQSFLVQQGAAPTAQQSQSNQAQPQAAQQSWGNQAKPAQQSWGNSSPQAAQQSWGNNQPQQGGQQAWQAQQQQQKAAAQQQQQAAQVARQQQQEQQAAAAQKQREQQQQAWQLKQQEEAMKKQQQMEEMKRRQEETKRKLEEQRAKQMEEQKNKMAEMQRLREEAIKKKQEAEQARKDELEAKRIAEEQRRLESKATFAIRRIIQKIRVATPENIEKLEAELAEESAKEMPNCGSQAEKMQEEADRGLEQAKTRIDKINQERAKEEQKKAEIEIAKKAKQEKAAALCEQLESLVEAAEAEAGKLKEAVKKLDLSEGAMTSQDVESSYKMVQDSEQICKDASKACMDLIKEESAAMKDPHALVETKQACAKLLQRIQESQKQVGTTMEDAKATKAKAMKKAVAQEKTNAIEKLFKKYDKDSDKALNQKEVLAYAKGEFGVKLEKGDMDWIWKSLVKGDAKGVSLGQLSQLRCVVGVSRELVRDEQRKADRIEKEKVIGGIRDKLKAKLTAAEKVVENADKAIKAAEQEVSTFNKARVTTASEIISLTEKSSKKLKEVRATYEKAKNEMMKCSQNLEPKYEKDLKVFLADLGKMTQIKMGRMETRMSRVETISRRYNGQAEQKEVSALEKLRTKALKVIYFNQVKNDQSNEELFNAFASGKDSVDEKAFLNFFESADHVVKPVLSEEAQAAEEEAKAKAAEVEAKAAEAEAEEEPKDEEMKEDEEAKEEEEEEEVSLLKEDGTEKTEEELKAEADQKKAEADKKKKEEEKKKKEEVVKKIKADAMKKIERAQKAAQEKKRKVAEEAKKKKEAEETENIEISKDELSTLFAYLDEESSGLSKERFFQITRRFMIVVKQTAMTSEMGVAGGKPLRKLESKEIIEVFKGPIRGTNEVSRVQCKALSDDLEGWVSVAGNQGTKFLMEGGNLYKVVKRSVMTDSFETSEETNADDANKLRPGTVLEVREFPRKEESSGLMRMQGKVRAADGRTGWVTIQSKDKKEFLKAI